MIFRHLIFSAFVTVAGMYLQYVVMRPGYFGDVPIRRLFWFCVPNIVEKKWSDWTPPYFYVGVFQTRDCEHEFCPPNDCRVHYPQSCFEHNCPRCAIYYEWELESTKIAERLAKTVTQHVSSTSGTRQVIAERVVDRKQHHSTVRSVRVHRMTIASSPGQPVILS